ncbi:putative plasma membrane zinc ion transporter [Aspergillus tanneri]|uniref:High-affinity Zn(2+) transporter zrt1 n=1 Tax=Aspergillus tanneri TaxID=1220188 RepID=A0A5M9M6W0_9EURO|nr:uncharacterized protein ATNIH1004_011426 [Aspergillus tanneri]KAA8642481.1 hypothetical protein ATNIH1004_011426 [Aspergillus tanneri]
MNCPSRTDDTLLHCEWNQNPPFLAPDLTTRQDLNGISNARERKDGSGLVGISFTSFDETWNAHTQQLDPEKNRSQGDGASLTPSGRLIHPATSADAGQGILSRNVNQSLPQSPQGWALWLLSVLLTAALISHDSILRSLHPTRHSIDAPPALPREQPRLPKRDTCATNSVNKREYNTGLHVAAVFIILSVSTLACVFPVLAAWSPRLRIPAGALFFVSHFGTGVLIATAFVHLLPTAFQSLNNPCLSIFWTEYYPAMPGAIALGGVFLVTVIEMVFSPARHCCRGGMKPGEQLPYVSGSNAEKSPTLPQIDITDHSTPSDTRDPPTTVRDSGHLRDMGPLIGRSSSMSRAISRMTEEPDRVVRISSAPEGASTGSEPKGEVVTRDVEQDDEMSLSPQQKHKKAIMQVVLLEMGILFHSVFIGMSLSVSVGNEFVILLVAIVFHQSFEGLALGSRIAALDWPDKALQPWLMSLAYGCTTPIGQAIGLATHTLYSPDSEVGLLLVGTMNAISAGLLIFASLVELMSEDFLSDESWRVLRGKRRVWGLGLDYVVVLRW